MKVDSDKEWDFLFVDICQEINGLAEAERKMFREFECQLDKFDDEYNRLEREDWDIKKTIENLQKESNKITEDIRRARESYVRVMNDTYRRKYEQRQQEYVEQKRRIDNELSKAYVEVKREREFLELLEEYNLAKKKYNKDNLDFMKEYPWYARYATWKDVEEGGKLRVEVKVNFSMKAMVKKLFVEKEPDWETLPVVISKRKLEKAEANVEKYINDLPTEDSKKNLSDQKILQSFLVDSNKKVALKMDATGRNSEEFWKKRQADFEKKLVIFKERQKQADIIREKAFLEKPFNVEFIQQLFLQVSSVDVNTCRRKLSEASKLAHVEDFFLNNTFPVNPNSESGKEQLNKIVANTEAKYKSIMLNKIQQQEHKQAECLREKNELEKKIEQANEKLERAVVAFREKLGKLANKAEQIREQNPIKFPVWLNSVTENEIPAYIKKVKETSSKRVCCSSLPVGYNSRCVSKNCLLFPELIPWCSLSEGCYNFEFAIPAGQHTQVLPAMNDLLMNMLLAYPIKKLYFTFVDIGLTNAAALFTTNVDSRLFHGNPIVDEIALNKRLDELNNRIVSTQYSNLIEYNQQNGVITIPYEVIVLLDFPGNLSTKTMDRLRLFFKNGYKGGIFFVVLRSIGEQNLDKVEVIDPNCFIRVPWVYRQLENTLNHYISVTGNSILFRACIDYINTEAAREEKVPILRQKMEMLYEAPLEDAVVEFKVPVGEHNGNPVYFQLDEVSHIHAFVMGKSGSGKSVFLHDVLNNALLRYSPETLQLYVLDFKLGGVEFNRYRGIKHIRALLVDNSDERITLEILRDLYQDMQRRGKLLREAGVSNIKEYNKLNPENKLPRIILLADECHELFKEYADRNAQKDVNEIITKIAKEGRSQGVHLLLATQTLANAVISGEILANITDSYLLACIARDAEKLISNSGKLTEGLLNGQVLYGYAGMQSIFKAYYADSVQLERNLKEVERKTSSCVAGQRFFFSGKQNFPLDESVVEQLRMKLHRHLLCFVGRSVDVKLHPVSFPLKKGLSENVLLFGIDTEGQTTRASLNVLITLMISDRLLQQQTRFFIINCLADEEEKAVVDLMWELEKYGCTILEGGESAALIARLAKEVRSQKAESTVVLLLGQERFRELRLDLPLPDTREAVEDTQPSSGNFLGNIGTFGRGRLEKCTYRSEIRYLLENGSGQGVHFLWQVDKPSKLLFEDIITPQMVNMMFKHVVMLYSSSEASMKLRLPDEIRLDRLSKDLERLRAYYYNDETGTYTLFTPYLNPVMEELFHVLK